MTHAQRVNMRYHKTDGGTVTLMVGVIIPHPRFGMVCFHEFKQEGGPQEIGLLPVPPLKLLPQPFAEVGVARIHTGSVPARQQEC